MFAEFDELSDSSRIWIYQSGRKLTTQEEASISQALHAFTQQWAAHGKPLKSSYKIAYHQFIILAADESAQEASGCSIDDSVHVIKQIDQHFTLDLFNRTNVGFLKNDEVQTMNQRELSSGLTDGNWDQNSLVFNNTINIKGDLKNNWVIPASQSWLKRYLTKLAV